MSTSVAAGDVIPGWIGNTGDVNFLLMMPRNVAKSMVSLRTSASASSSASCILAQPIMHILPR